MTGRKAEVTTLQRKTAATLLEDNLKGFRGELTVADAAAKGGLALREAEAGLHTLVASYRGHLAATDKGELLFRFPDGFQQPAERRWWRRALRRVAKALAGAARFTVRAWVSIVLVLYALVFGAILVALALRGGDDRDTDVGDVLAMVGRVLLEALYWTFHPFSPVWVATEPGWIRARGPRVPRVPFYERVNRFVFGPAQPPPDPREETRRVLTEVRRLDGRIGLGDVVRVTGLPRGEADAQISQLMLDFNGEVEVTDEGAIVYKFPELRRTAASTDRQERAPAPVWGQRVELAPLTNNPAGTNVLFGAINGFNLVMSGTAIANSWTVERLTYEVQQASQRHSEPMTPPPDGTPLVLGWIPFAFSMVLFALPLGRTLLRGRRRRAVEKENGRRAVMRAVWQSSRADVPQGELRAAFRKGAGRDAADDELLEAARALGGELELGQDGSVVYRFEDLIRERRALTRARAEADGGERDAGAVVFSSDREAT